MHETITPLDRAKASLRYTKAMSLINGAVESFIETGVAVIRGTDMSGIDYSDWKAKFKRYRTENTSIATPMFVRSFVRKVAQDLKRPIVFAVVDGWAGERVTVTIKKLKRNEVVAAPFLLALESDSRWRKVDPKTPLWGHQDKTNWYFHFDGPNGRKAFEAWFEQCKTDPAFRKAMKLTPTDNPEK